MDARDRFGLRNDLPILQNFCISHFYLLRDERKGRDSVRVNTVK